MTPARARPFFLRSVLLVGMLAGAVAFLLLQRPSAGSAAVEGDLRRLLGSLADLALVVPSASSGVAPFFVERTEVTNERFAAFVAATGYAPEQPGDFLTELRIDGSLRVGEELARRPVAFVSAADAEAYARWRGGRLPTHMEWMDLIGAAAHAAFEPRGVVSRYRHNLLETGLERTAIVGTFESGKTHRRSSVVAPPVYDLIGNVAEWVRAAGPGTPDYGILGGSFRDSTDRALDRFFGEFEAAERRSDAIGFRCLLPDATSFARTLLAALSRCDDSTFKSAIAELRPFGAPLERLIESIRIADARVGETPLDPPFAIRDALHDLGDGRILRFQRSRDGVSTAGGIVAPWSAELIDSERGVVDAVGIGTIRGEPYLEFEGEEDRVLFATQGEDRAESGSRLHLAIEEDRVAILDVVTHDELRPLPELPVFRVHGFARSLPRCVATEPARLSFSACPGTASGMDIQELTIAGDRLTVRRLAGVTAAEDLHASSADSRIYAFGTIGLSWPSFDPNCIDLPDVIAAGYSLPGGDRLSNRALLLPEGDVPPHRADSRSDRLFVFLADGTLGIVEGLAAGEPRWIPSRPLPDPALRYLSSTRIKDGAIVEAADRKQERVVLLELDRGGRVRTTREIENLGTRRTEIVRLRDGTILLFDSEGAMHRLDERLESKFVTKSRAYAADIAAPALVDFDHDGVAELIAAASHESFARIDLETGEELDRWSFDDRTLLAIVSPPATAPECGVMLAVNDRGLFRLGAGSTRVDAAARRLSRALRDERTSESQP